MGVLERDSGIFLSQSSVGKRKREVAVLTYDHRWRSS